MINRPTLTTDDSSLSECSRAIAAADAGAVICGAYFGDKMTPLSETTILVPQLVGGGRTTGEHIRNMSWTAGPARAISLGIFLFIGPGVDSEAPISTDAALDAVESTSHISALNPLPLALLGVQTASARPQRESEAAPPRERTAPA